MPDFDPPLRAECGWTGTKDERVKEEWTYQCPICAEVVEYVEQWAFKCNLLSLRYSLSIGYI